MGVDLTAIGAGLGKTFAPVATAAGAAGQSLQLGTIATGANVAAQLFSGIGGMEQMQYQASQASSNAEAARLAGQEQESASKMRYGALEAKQIAGQAANGIQVNEGSAKAVVDSTKAISAMDAALIHYNAQREAFGEEQQAGAYKAAAKGALIKGVLGAGTSFLSGTQSLADKWLMYQQSGALSVPAGGN